MRHPNPKWEDRFWSKVNMLTSNGCWLWTGTVTDQGYGHFSVGKKKIRAHRLAYRLCVGYIPGLLTIDHMCDTALCVNPSHMELRTAPENASRAWKINPDHGGKGRPRATKCRYGHPYLEKDRAYLPGGRWKHRCSACAHERYIKQKVGNKNGRT